MTDTTELRRLAETLPLVEWNADVKSNGSARVYFAPDATDERPENSDWIPTHGYGAEAAYIAAANPKTVLELIAERDDLLQQLSRTARQARNASGERQGYPWD